MDANICAVCREAGGPWNYPDKQRDALAADVGRVSRIRQEQARELNRLRGVVRELRADAWTHDKKEPAEYDHRDFLVRNRPSPAQEYDAETERLCKGKSNDNSP